jgi:hypothetical protein
MNLHLCYTPPSCTLPLIFSHHKSFRLLLNNVYEKFANSPSVQWFKDEASSVELGTADGCYLYSESDCCGDSVTVNLNKCSLGEFDKRLGSFHCFGAPHYSTILLRPASSTTTSVATTIASSSSISLPPSSTAVASSSLVSSADPSTASGATIGQTCRSPMAIFWSEVNYAGTEYEACGRFHECYNVPSDFRGQAESFLLGRAGSCTLYPRAACRGAPFFVATDYPDLGDPSDPFGGFDNRLLSYRCERFGPPPEITITSTVSSSLPSSAPPSSVSSVVSTAPSITQQTRT